MIRLKIERTAYGGDGIALHEGKTCFVRGALPGETVEAEILQEKKDLVRLRTLRVIEASPHRVDPPCEVYGRCGGCQYQHVTYEEELRQKRTQLRETLQKIGGIQTPVSDILHGQGDYRYRISATFHVKPSKKEHSGFFYVAQDNESLVPVRDCALLEESLSRLFHLPPRPTGAAEKITFKVDENGKIVSDREEMYYRVRVLGEQLIANSKGFFQNNLAVTGLLCEKVRDWVSLARPTLFYDLYAGVGTFGLLCVAPQTPVIAVEENPYSLAALDMNRQEKKRVIEIIAGRVESIFPGSWVQRSSEEALILMDPPRQGLEKGLARFLAADCRAKALVYVSCDMTTLARDLKIIVGGGHWAVREIVPVDMFPRTKHLETAVLLASVS